MGLWSRQRELGLLRDRREAGVRGAQEGAGVACCEVRGDRWDVPGRAGLWL